MSKIITFKSLYYAMEKDYLDKHRIEDGLDYISCYDAEHNVKHMHVTDVFDIESLKDMEEHYDARFMWDDEVPDGFVIKLIDFFRDEVRYQLRKRYEMQN